MRFPFCRNRDSVKNGILISIRRTGDGFHPGLFTWGLIVRGVHEGLVWGGFVRGSLNSTWLLKYHNKQSRQGHSCKAVLKRILDDFFYYDWELIKPEINISITSFLSPQVCPSWKTLTKDPQQLCCFYSETLTKAPQQVWQTLKNFDYPSYSTVTLFAKFLGLSTSNPLATLT